MPLLHLPVQSGSTKILKEMNRKHSLKEYINIVQRLKTKNPSIEFSSDFIIAYPGENDNDFLDTVNLMEKIKFINTYSFLYSPRPGTPAAELETIDIIKAKKRLEIFQDIAKNIKTKYRKKLVKTTATVLFENQIKNENKYFGRDEYSNSVIVQSDKNLIGQIIKVQIENFNQNTLFGNIASNSVQPIFA
jgi:tRNA-2-methylthio-N6-dimethylallyladenosine synthase